MVNLKEELFLLYKMSMINKNYQVRIINKSMVDQFFLKNILINHNLSHKENNFKRQIDKNKMKELKERFM